MIQLATMRRFTGLVAGVCVAAWCATADAETVPAWWLDAQAVIGIPVNPTAFSDGWDVGFGLVGGVHRNVGSHYALGLEGEFVQFGYAGKSGVVSGGTRRVGRIVVPLRVWLWRAVTPSADAIAFDLGVGYSHQSIETISGTQPPQFSGKSDGVAWNAGLHYSRVLYQKSRVAFGAQYEASTFEDESPGYFAFRFGIEAPLGSGPD